MRVIEEGGFGWKGAAGRKGKAGTARKRGGDPAVTDHAGMLNHGLLERVTGRKPCQIRRGTGRFPLKEPAGHLRAVLRKDLIGLPLDPPERFADRIVAVPGADTAQSAIEGDRVAAVGDHKGVHVRDRFVCGRYLAGPDQPNHLPQPFVTGREASELTDRLPDPIPAGHFNLTDLLGKRGRGRDLVSRPCR